MARLQLNSSMMKVTAGKYHNNEVEERNYCSNPQQGFIKLNFNGAMKGNLEEARIGGVFRDDRGRTFKIYVMDCGNATNNEAELHALRRGLEMTIREKYQKCRWKEM